MTAESAALERQHRGLREWIALLSRCSAGASLFERSGVRAAVVPVAAERSIVNSVSYSDPVALLAALDELAAAYATAGVRAWTVWVPEFDRETAAALETAGHRLDGSPTAMSLDLDGYQPPPLGDLDWDRECEPAELGTINVAAYGLPSGDGLEAALLTPPADPTLRLYRARVEGETAAVLGTIDHGSDLGFYFVATDPARRGRGLASRLIAAALEQARERGLRSSTLQASPMGRPVYERLGYRPDFTLGMYERRAA